MPDGSTPGETMDLFSDDADLTYFFPELVLTGGGGTTYDLRIRITAPNTTNKLYKLNNMTLRAAPETTEGKIVNWALSGGLADKLGIAQE